MPKPRRGEPFIKGPLYWSYWSRVGRTSPQALRLAMAIKYWAGFRRGRGVTRGVRVGLADTGELGLNPRSARIAMCSLEAAGLVAVERRPGRKPIITLRDGQRPKRDPTLHLPIPWIWWHRACALPGRALRVAVALWFQGGWLGNRAEFPFDLSRWESLGLTRFSAGRGVQSLEAARLISVERRPGRSPVVMVLDAPIWGAERVQSLAKPDECPGSDCPVAPPPLSRRDRPALAGCCPRSP